jgi:hypothetical protein
VAVTTEDYVAKFVDCVHSQGLGLDLSVDDVKPDMRRAELGISSLEVIVVVAAYIAAGPDSSLQVAPEWVPRLDDVAGILSVLEEIDRSVGAVA